MNLQPAGVSGDTLWRLWGRWCDDIYYCEL